MRPTTPEAEEKKERTLKERLEAGLNILKVFLVEELALMDRLTNTDQYELEEIGMSCFFRNFWFYLEIESLQDTKI